MNVPVIPDNEARWITVPSSTRTISRDKLLSFSLFLTGISSLTVAGLSVKKEKNIVIFMNRLAVSVQTDSFIDLSDFVPF